MHENIAHAAAAQPAGQRHRILVLAEGADLNIQALARFLFRAFDRTGSSPGASGQRYDLDHAPYRRDDIQFAGGRVGQVD